MKYLESIVGNQMNVIQHTGKALKSMLVVLILSIACLSLGYGSAQGTSTLTPVQTETELKAQESSDLENTTYNTSENPAVVVTTVVTEPTTEVVSADSRVCDALASQIVSNLAKYPDWQISLNDENGNVQGHGEMGSSGLELQLFNPNAIELYLYYFTDAEAITIANSNGLRISLFENNASVTSDSANANAYGIIINATIGENREASPINDCILRFEQVFPNYIIK